MTTLALVTDTYVEPDELDTEATPTLAAQLTPAEKAIIKGYVTELKSRGFCVLNDATANYTRLFNRYEDAAISMSFLSADFNRQMLNTKKTCRLPTNSYLTLRLENIVGKKFVPNAGDYFTTPVSKCTYANTWRGYVPTFDSTELTPLFEEFFERLIPIKDDRILVLQWLSHIFQHPEQRPSWHVMMPSDTGVGKGFLVEKILQPLLYHTAVISSFGKLTGRFSTLLEDKVLLLLDDCKARTASQQLELKSLLSEERTHVEHKGKDAGMVNTYTRMILASNESKPLDLEENERRWFVLEKLVHLESPEETQAFLRELLDWLELPGSLDAVHHFFMSYDTDDFNHKQVRKTKALFDIVEKSKGLDADILQGLITSNVLFTGEEWMAHYATEGLNRPGNAKQGELLATAGYERYQLVLIPGKPEKVRLCRPIGMDVDATRAAYNATHTPPSSPF